MIGVLVLPRDEDRDETIIVGHVIEQIRSRDSEEPTLPLASSNTRDEFSNRLDLKLINVRSLPVSMRIWIRR